MSIKQVVNSYEKGRKKELKILKKFNLGVFTEDVSSNPISNNVLNSTSGLGNIAIKPNSNGSFLPLLADHSTGSSYRDLGIYFDIDYFVSLGLFGYTLNNWYSLLCSRKDLSLYVPKRRDRHIKGCLSAANCLWTNHGLIAFRSDRVCTVDSQLVNLKTYLGFSDYVKSELTYDLKMVLIS